MAKLDRAAELFPYYAGPGNPYVLLAELYESRGQKAEAAATQQLLFGLAKSDAGYYTSHMSVVPFYSGPQEGFFKLSENP